MKRDLDLTRNILEQIEEKSNGMPGMVLDLPGHTENEVSYHVKVLSEAGLLTAMDLTDSMGLDWRPISLTWHGHEFLDAIRNETVWKKIKETVKEKGGAIPFEILKTLAIQFAGSVFGVGG